MKDILVPDLLLHVCDFFTEYIGAVSKNAKNETKNAKKCQIFITNLINNFTLKK
jgi:hypothetical protein